MSRAVRGHFAALFTLQCPLLRCSPPPLTMPRKCYLLSMPKINNPEQFGKYFAAASATFPKTGMRVLAAADTDSALCAERDTAQTTSKAVLVEFDSKEAAMAWWNSEEYQSTVADRHESTTGGLLIAEGVDESDGLPMIENPKAFLMAFVKFTSDKIMVRARAWPKGGRGGDARERRSFSKCQLRCTLETRGPCATCGFAKPRSLHEST